MSAPPPSVSAGGLATASLAPATRSADLRDHLPAIEPERTVSDWGRSERLEGLLDATLSAFLYHSWFRCEVEGIEHVPSTGGALLVSNHAGALAPDASMIAKAIQEEHPRPRKLHLTVEHNVCGYPFVSMFVAKVGGVPAHPANVHRLLFDEQQLVLGRGGLVAAAMRAGVPIVPVAVAGAEEAMPASGPLGLLRRLTGLLSVPVAPLAYLPAKFRLRFLPPVATDGTDPDDKGRVQDVADEVRARIQEELAERRSVWLG